MFSIQYQRNWTYAYMSDVVECSLDERVIIDDISLVMSEVGHVKPKCPRDGPRIDFPTVNNLHNKLNEQRNQYIYTSAQPAVKDRHSHNS